MIISSKLHVGWLVVAVCSQVFGVASKLVGYPVRASRSARQMALCATFPFAFWSFPVLPHVDAMFIIILHICTKFVTYLN